MQTHANDFWKLFKPKNCSTKIKGNTREEVFAEIVANFTGGGDLPEELVAAANRALIEREQLASTGVGRGVAIPHIKLEGLEHVVLSVSLRPEGVEWDALDGEAVDIFFTVLRPARASEQHDPERHLEMMRWIARLCRDGDFQRFARAATTKTELVNLLKENAGL